MKSTFITTLLILIFTAFFACKKNTPVIEPKEPEIIYPEIPPPDLPCLGPDCTIKDYHNIDDQATWSNDGKWIAYLHRDLNPKKIGIYVIKPDGTENRMVLNGATLPIQDLSWAADGQSIWFGSSTQFCNINIITKELRKISLPGLTFNPKVSPNGQWLTYHRSYSSPEPITVMGIWRVRTDGSTNEQLYAGNSGYPFWAGNEINFLRGAVSLIGSVIGDSILFYNEQTKKAEGKIFIQPDITYGIFSPTTNKYLYTSTAVSFTPELWIMNSDGSEKKRLKVQGYLGEISKDGTAIVYTDTRRINGRLWIMDADGNNQRQLTFYEQFK